MSDIPTIEIARKRYGTTKNRGIVKYVLIYDEKTNKPLAIDITVRSPKPVETLYERELPKEDLERYEFAGGSPYIKRGTAVAEIRKKYSKEYWDKQWGVQKVELAFKGVFRGKPDEEPYLIVTRLDKDPKETEEEKKFKLDWVKSAPKRLLFGKDRAGFKHLETRFHDYFNQNYTEYTGPVPIGTVREAFKAPNGEKVHIFVTEWQGESYPTHEFLRYVYKSDYTFKKKFKVEQTSNGTLLVLRQTKRFPPEMVKNYGVKAKSTTVFAWWTCGNISICLRSRDVDLEEKLKIIEDRYPSSLPKDINIDKAIWHKAEIEIILARLNKVANLDKLTPYDWFHLNFAKLYDIAEMPYSNRDAGKGLSFENQKKTYEKLAAWWKENKDKLVWDKKKRKLVMKE